MRYFFLDISKKVKTINVYFEVERVHENVYSESKNVIVKYGGRICMFRPCLCGNQPTNQLLVYVFRGIWKHTDTAWEKKICWNDV